MQKRIHFSESFFIELQLGFSQLISIVFLFIILFAAPIYVHQRLLDEQNKPPTAEEIEETYTSSALNQDNPTNGSVAGASTSIYDQASKITIPVINFDFDPSLKDSASVSFLFGGAFAIISLLLGGILIVDTMRS